MLSWLRSAEQGTLFFALYVTLGFVSGRKGENDSLMVRGQRCVYLGQLVEQTVRWTPDVVFSKGSTLQ